MKYGSVVRKLLDCLVWSVAASVLLIFLLFLLHFLMTALSSLFPNLFDGANFHGGALSGAPNQFRNFSEFLYFYSQIVIPFMALAAGLIAYRQFRESENSRIIGIYMQINNRFDSKQVAFSRRKLSRLAQIYKINPQGCNTLGEYVNSVLMKEYEQSVSFANGIVENPTERSKINHDFRSYLDAKPSPYKQSMFLLDFLEDVGLYVRKKHVNVEDINDFIGGPIRSADSMLRLHIMVRNGRRATGGMEPHEQGQNQNKITLYANALYLMDEMEMLKNRKFSYTEKAPG